ncbi:MAG: hypothetical protein C0169_00745 [Thermodesulfobacterium geofontis]|uniref:Uncharacterized protein n=1 Tax=Thermodesulfobacterium geofontis TaxID=1295609 RepID=A0A2N7QGF4_9BACT|nr:MAG: hypothetical protein C0169_00745 [Thermodesulfobacterium geofontis]
MEVVKYLSQKSTLSLDVQGLVRNVKEGKIEEICWEEKDEGLAYIDILKANEREAKILTGIKNFKKAGKN